VFETTTENLETTTVFEETTILDEDDPNFNWRARGVQRKRKKIATTTETSGKYIHFQSFNIIKFIRLSFYDDQK